MVELKAHKLKAQIQKLQAELVAHQNRCKHLKVVRIPRGNTGNYDPTQDCYWLDCSCETCLKRWTEDQ